MTHIVKNILSSLMGYVRLSLQQSKRGSRSPSGGRGLAALVNTQTDTHDSL